MPTEFTCPNCGDTTEVEDQYVGQSGPCLKCGKTVTVLPPEGSADQGSSWPVGRVIIGLAVLFLAVGLILPAIQYSPNASPHRRCSFNMKQIGIGLQNYQAANGSFPPAYTVDEDGNRLHSWRTLILPYMEQQSTYDLFDMDEPWDSPKNQPAAAAARDAMWAVYLCPENTANPDETNYVMIVGPNTISSGEKGASIEEISDGASQTILIVEVSGLGIPWAEPRNLNADEITFGVNDGTGGISSEHIEGAWALFADGSVHNLDDSITPNLIEALSTIASGEEVTWPIE